ncbi:Fur family transcriptional regulator [Arthrobacter sp. H14-L1]|uniref:Fur family transcriptional regulator n=1 Tax=Arthrobacter sp. H14-L1 TaxID=2996697 RepID=UPI00226D5C49|nr:Fur family transcriptional regulator [Arthrobacter sp. H14-L1]MCY0904560.1 Fur family transcriptional regulator [Arthrobacter sp. H14-L1]
MMTGTRTEGGSGATAEHEWEQQLHSHDRRVTKQRLAVLAAVARSQHSTAEAITAAIRAELPSITVQSIYVVLADLTRLGMLRRIEPPNSPARYETRTGDNHHHAICTSCGRIEDVDCAVGHAPCLTPELDAGATIGHIIIADVLYQGTCSACAATANEPLTVKPDEVGPSH